MPAGGFQVSVVAILAQESSSGRGWVGVERKDEADGVVGNATVDWSGTDWHIAQSNKHVLQITTTSMYNSTIHALL